MKCGMIFGPFVGEMIYEMSYFAPYAIYKKKNDPNRQLVVFTRPDRLDLYGQYVDIFVPLNLKDDDESFQSGWSSSIYNSEVISSLISVIKSKFVSRFHEVSHFIPYTKGNLSYVRWQFPRNEMDYDFKPRLLNLTWVLNNIGNDDFIFCESKNYSFNSNVVYFDDLKENYYSSQNESTTFLGVLIETIRKCKLVIGKLNSLCTRAAFLLKRPVISIDSEKGDYIHLINPFRVPVIISDTVSHGVKFYYENNI